MTLPITECTFPADKGYDVKNIYNQVKGLYEGKCIIPLTNAIRKILNFSHKEIQSAKQGFPCGRMVNFLIMVVPARNSAVL